MPNQQCRRPSWRAKNVETTSERVVRLALMQHLFMSTGIYLIPAVSRKWPYSILLHAANHSLWYSKYQKAKKGWESRDMKAQRENGMRHCHTVAIDENIRMKNEKNLNVVGISQAHSEETKRPKSESSCTETCKPAMGNCCAQKRNWLGWI